MSAIAEVSASALSAPQAPSWTSRFSGMDQSQRMKLALGAALMVALTVAAIMLGRTPDWRVLYANLGDKDGGAVIAQLSTMNVPYKYTDGGGAIMVPADRVHDVRLRLASQGLPKGSVSGFELMENNRFGMTQFQEKLTFQRGLEGELTRSIQALSSVQSARVHLALPQQNGFFREQQKPTASVLVSLYPGRTLDRAQLAGIVHLVASSVPEMAPAAVSVLDDTGKLLSGPVDGNGANGDAQQLQYQQQVEQQYARRILDILEPIVGRDNVKAQVNADLDFSQTESTTEQHTPNLSPEASAVRSQQVVETPGAGGGAGGGAAAATGIPGAASNQPAAASAAPINGAAVPLRAASAAGAAGGAGAALGAGGRRESITNYEVDKTIRTTRAAAGAVKRLSAAVVVNYAKNTDAAGKVTQAALDQKQIDQMTALVRESIGFSKDRGDSVNLVNAPFQAEATPAETPIWKRPELLDTLRSLAWPAGLVVTALIILMGFVRPGLKALAASKPVAPQNNSSQLNAVLSELPPRPALLSPEQAAHEANEQMRIEDARLLARQNPAAVANIVKNWVHGDAPA